MAKNISVNTQYCRSKQSPKAFFFPHNYLFNCFSHHHCRVTIRWKLGTNTALSKDYFLTALYGYTEYLLLLCQVLWSQLSLLREKQVLHIHMNNMREESFARMLWFLNTKYVNVVLHKHEVCFKHMGSRNWTRIQLFWILIPMLILWQYGIAKGVLSSLDFKTSQTP